MKYRYRRNVAPSFLQKLTSRFDRTARHATLAVTCLTAVSLIAIPFIAARSLSIQLAASSPAVQVVSPQVDATVHGTITLTADLSEMSVNDYDMFWYVDNGTWNWMGNSSGQNTKQADIDLTQWTWHSTPDYTITIVGVLHGSGARVYGGVPIHIGNAEASSPAAADLYVNPSSSAAQTAAQTADPIMKRVMTKLAAAPTASWFGNWTGDVRGAVSSVVDAAAAANRLPVLVAYNIPNRDCGSYSAGGSGSAGDYQAWIDAFAAGIGQHTAIVILEPDALAQITCLSGGDQAARYQLLSAAVATLKADPSVRVYLDAGNPNWVTAQDMAARLKSADIAAADGFSLNVSNFIATGDDLSYGDQLSGLVGGKHFVVDTSRNGNGSSGEWCNPSGRALGRLPTSQTGDAAADYFLWIKTPGESDGTCNGGPAAGTWWPQYAEALALAANW